MYTILMDDDKTLTQTIAQKIYQRENLVDTFHFLFPETYNALDLSKCTAVIKYVTPDNVPHAEHLVKSEKLYKGKLEYFLPVDTGFTKCAGNIHLRISFIFIDYEKKQQKVLHTSETVIPVLPLNDYYNFVPEESLEFVDKMFASFDSKIKEMESIAETYDKEKADNIIKKDDNKIQLTSHGELIGNEITISGGGSSSGECDGFEIIEF